MQRRRGSLGSMRTAVSVLSVLSVLVLLCSARAAGAGAAGAGAAGAGAAGAGVVDSSSVTSGETESRPAAFKYAYALIHYEGTKLDAEYLLGARVLIASLLLSHPQADVVVLVSETVSSETRHILAETGARLKFVKDIPNPYKHSNAGEGAGAGVGKDGVAGAGEEATYKAHFEHSLNKLHLWNMVEYDRVIYMDEDSICLRNMDELFKCGHMCAAFQNPVNFHTGLLVVKPDTAVFDDMMQALASGMLSYDGGDQGFFVSYFAGLAEAPLFDRHAVDDGSSSDAPLMRLDIAYSMNHIYYYEKFNFKLYRVSKYPELKSATVPAFSMSYPIAQSFKPWNWVPYWYMDIHWVWLSFRKTLDDDTPLLNFVRLVGTPAVVLAVYTQVVVARFGAQLFGSNSLLKSTLFPLLVKVTSVPGGVSFAVWAIALSLLFAVSQLSAALIPSTTYPLWAWPTYVVLHLTFVWSALDALGRFTSANTAPFVRPQSLVPLALLAVSTLYICMSVRFPEFISKLGFTFVMVALVIDRHAALVRAQLAHMRPTGGPILPGPGMAIK